MYIKFKQKQNNKKKIRKLDIPVFPLFRSGFGLKTNPGHPVRIIRF